MTKKLFNFQKSKCGHKGIIRLISTDRHPCFPLVQCLDCHKIWFMRKKRYDKKWNPNGYRTIITDVGTQVLKR